MSGESGATLRFYRKSCLQPEPAAANSCLYTYGRIDCISPANLLKNPSKRTLCSSIPHYTLFTNRTRHYRFHRILSSAANVSNSIRLIHRPGQLSQLEDQIKKAETHVKGLSTMIANLERQEADRCRLCQDGGRCAFTAGRYAVGTESRY